MSKQQQLRQIELEESIVPATGGDGMLINWQWWVGGGVGVAGGIILGIIIIIIP